MTTIRLIDHALYPRLAVSEARTAYKDYCSVRVEPMTANQARLAIDVLPPHMDKEREVILSFMNFALDKALELQLADL
jgi:hypothetical protein